MHFSNYVFVISASAAITSALPIPVLSARAVNRLSDFLTNQAHQRDDTATRAFSNVAIKTDNGQCLFIDKLSGDIRANNLPVQVRTCDGSQAQQFDVITAGKHNDQPGTMLIVSSLTQGCLNFNPNSLTGNAVSIFSCGGRANGRGDVTTAQLFQMTDIRAAAAGPISLVPMNGGGNNCIGSNGSKLDKVSCSTNDPAQAFAFGVGNNIGGGNGGGNGGGDAVRPSSTLGAVITTIAAGGNGGGNAGNGGGAPVSTLTVTAPPNNGNGGNGGGAAPISTVTVTAPNNNNGNNGNNGNGNNGNGNNGNGNNGNGNNGNGNGNNGNGNNGNGNNGNGNGNGNNGNGNNGNGGGAASTTLPSGFSEIQAGVTPTNGGAGGGDAAPTTSTTNNAVGGGDAVPTGGSSTTTQNAVGGGDAVSSTVTATRSTTAAAGNDGADAANPTRTSANSAQPTNNNGNGNNGNGNNGNGNGNNGNGNNGNGNERNGQDEDDAAKARREVKRQATRTSTMITRTVSSAKST